MDLGITLYTCSVGFFDRFSNALLFAEAGSKMSPVSGGAYVLCGNCLDRNTGFLAAIFMVTGSVPFLMQQ